MLTGLGSLGGGGQGKVNGARKLGGGAGLNLCHRRTLRGPPQERRTGPAGERLLQKILERTRKNRGYGVQTLFWGVTLESFF